MSSALATSQAQQPISSIPKRHLLSVNQLGPGCIVEPWAKHNPPGGSKPPGGWIPLAFSTKAEYNPCKVNTRQKPPQRLRTDVIIGCHHHRLHHAERGDDEDAGARGDSDVGARGGSGARGDGAVCAAGGGGAGARGDPAACAGGGGAGASW
jgi:hypothetical protein